MAITDQGKKEATTCGSWAQDDPRTIHVIRNIDRVRCNANLTDYIFNLTMGRFLSVYVVGYLDGKDNNEDTPSISGGERNRF